MLKIPSRPLLLCLFLMLPLATACGRDGGDAATVETAQPAEDTGPPAELVSASNGYVAAWNGSDPAAVGQYFTDEAVAVVGDSTFTGRPEVQRGWLDTNVPIVSDLRFTEESLQEAGEDFTASGRFTATATPPGAEPVPQTGTYRVTWTRTPAGEWRVRRSETRTDVPADTVPAPPS